LPYVARQIARVDLAVDVPRVPFHCFFQPVSDRRRRVVAQQATRLVDVGLRPQLIAGPFGLLDDPGGLADDRLDGADTLTGRDRDVGADVENLADTRVPVLQYGDEPVDNVPDVGVAAQVVLAALV
jgi:hypothetical protein